MDTNILMFLPSKPPPLAIPTYTTPSIKPKTLRRSSLKLSASDNTGNEEEEAPKAPSITPPETVEIRFKRGSRRRKNRRVGDNEGVGDGKPFSVSPRAPKKWEEMNIQEKVGDLYVGEKGLLFWLNKFAYASIFIVIGGWIVFRFVGPALNLYQLDTSPLAPSSMFKGS